MNYTNALVTGASSGLGRGVALWLAKRNIKVWAAARRLDALQALKAEAPEHIVPFKLDVSNGELTEAAVRQLDQACGGLDLVVVNAGVGAPSSPKHMKWPDIANMLNVNVVGATATVCGALPGMVERKRGHIVGISSVAAFGGILKLGAYAGTKAYLATYLQGLRLDTERHGILVSVLHPGYVKTEMTADLKGLPFLMEADDAVEEIGQAILRGAKSHTFPWQMRIGWKTIASLPRPLYEAAARKMR